MRSHCARFDRAAWRERARTFGVQWDSWWCRESPPHALALFRIVFGAFLLLYWGSMLPGVPLLFSEEGISLPLFDRGLPDLFLLLFSPPPPWVAWVIFTVLLLSFALITCGVGMRVAGILAIVLHEYYRLSSHHVSWFTMEQLSIILLLILSFSGADRTLSLRMWRTRGSTLAWEPVSVLPQRLLALQLTATLLGAGWQKVVLSAWQGGEILAYSMMGHWSTPLAYRIARLQIPLWYYDRAVDAVKVFGVFLPFGLWSRRWRWWWILGLLLYLVSITLFLTFWWFLVLVPACIVVFEPEEVYAKLKAWSSGRIPAAPVC